METTSPGRLRRYREQEDSEPLLAQRLAWQNEPSYRLRKKAWLVQRPSRTYLYCTRHDLLYLIAGPTSLSLNLKILPSIPQLVWQRQIPTTPTALGCLGERGRRRGCDGQNFAQVDYCILQH
ncbi:hypothetical protein V8C40DRAFT_239046 [Trichoderma camerunense]